MPHGLTILTATMTGGAVAAPAAGTATGSWCCPCCPGWCPGFCCPGSAAAAVPVAPHAAGVAAVPVAQGYAPVAGSTGAGIAALPGGWGMGGGGPLPAVGYAPPVYGSAAGTPALTGAMSIFIAGRDRAGELLKRMRETALSWKENLPLDRRGETSEHGKRKLRRNSSGVSRSTGASSSGSGERLDRDIARKCVGRTVKRSEAVVMRRNSRSSSSDTNVFRRKSKCSTSSSNEGVFEKQQVEEEVFENSSASALLFL